MFYKVLLILACYNFYKSLKSFFRENVTVEGGEVAKIATSAYISAAVIGIFHIMVIAICLVPSILF